MFKGDIYNNIGTMFKGDIYNNIGTMLKGDIYNNIGTMFKGDIYNNIKLLSNENTILNIHKFALLFMTFALLFLLNKYSG